MPRSLVFNIAGPAPLFVPNPAPRKFVISGQTIDSNGDPLSDCTVDLFESQNPKLFRGQKISDVNGNYSFDVTEGLAHRVVSNKLSGERFRFYFHIDTTRNGAPTAPAGCATISVDDPDELEANADDGGHMSSSLTGTDASQLNKPFTRDDTGVAGSPPVTAPPIAAHQFGWFSDTKYTGTFQAGQWFFKFRENDNTVGIVGRPVVNLYANATRDFSGMRFLGQFESTADWWQGFVNTQFTGSQLGAFTLANEYLFVQLWCHEVEFLAATLSLVFHQEGSDLDDDLRSLLITAPFTQASQTQVAGVTLDNLLGTAS